MNLSDVQPFIASQIGEDPTLGPASAVVSYDPNATQDVQRSAITATVKRVGFCLEIGLPYIANNERQTNNAGVSFSHALIPVYVAEDRSLPHTPTGTTLVNYVEAAVNKRLDQRHVTGTHSIAAAESDAGLILWEIVFIVQVQTATNLPTITAGLTP